MIEYKLKKGNILKDGHTMFPKDIVKDLNRKAYLEDLKSKTEFGAQVPCTGVLSALSKNLSNSGDAVMASGDEKKERGDNEGARTMYTIGGLLGLLGQALEDSLSR
jgi:hypothetical protein